ncbi:MAG TPA: hypothetical protein PLA11_14585 [Flavobacteriales bacterium]|nr:hypothetical protein [Flavobacteriales bacterium]HPQ59358.1 hypothetical protein [Flavobacteriales bacterium]
MKRLPLLSMLVLSGLAASSQVNDQGTIHLAVGVNAGGHATQYEQTIRILGVPITSKESDGAATVTFPIEFQYGLAKVFSLGVYFEPGSYLDSSATRTNGLVLFGIAPRFYLVNNERFAWTAGLQFGGSTLRIDDSDALGAYTSTYRGPNFGLSSGVAFQFSDLIGLHLRARFLTTSLALKELERNGNGQSLDNYEADLNTGGFTLGASLAFRF